MTYPAIVCNSFLDNMHSCSLRRIIISQVDHRQVVRVRIGFIMIIRTICTGSTRVAISDNWTRSESIASDTTPIPILRPCRIFNLKEIVNTITSLSVAARILTHIASIEFAYTVHKRRQLFSVQEEKDYLPLAINVIKPP